MALQKQNMTISFSKGIDTKTDPKQVMVGKLTYLQNCVFKSTNRLQKRNGYAKIATNSSISSGNFSSAYKDELIVGDGSNLYSYTSANSNVVNKGTKVSLDIDTNPVIRNTYSQSTPDSVSLSNYSVYVWTDSSGGCRYSVLDTSTNSIIVSSGLILSTASKPKVRTVGTNFVIFFVDTVSVSYALKYVSISTSTPTVLSSAVTVAATTGNYYDAQTINSKIFITYTDASTNTDIKSLDSALTLSSATVVAVTSTYQCIFGDPSNNVWVVYYDGTNVKYFIRSSTLTAVLAATTIETVASVTAVTGVYNSTGYFFYQVGSVTTSASSSNVLTRKNTGSVAGSVGTAASYLRQTALYSKPFIYNSVLYMVISYQSNLQNTYFVTNLSGGVVAKIAPSSGGGIRSTDGTPLAEVNLVSSGVYQLPFQKITAGFGSSQTVTGNAIELKPSATNIVYIYGIYNCQLTFGTAVKSDYLGNNLHLSGGILTMYDGNNTVEHGFNLFPENLQGQVGISGGSSGGSTTPIAPSTGGLSGGTYGYQSTYEWTDNQGQIHRSAPSPTLSIPFNATTATVPFLASTTNGSTTVVTSGESARFLSIGKTVTGANIPANTVITQILGFGGIVISNAATSTVALTLNVSSNYSFTASASFANGSLYGVATAGPLQFAGLFWGDTTSGSPVLKITNPLGLKVGMFLEDRTISGGGILSGRILSISGNTVTMDTNAASTTFNNSIGFQASIQETVTYGATATVTGVPASMIALAYVGQTIYNSHFAGGTTIASKTSNTITMSVVSGGGSGTTTLYIAISSSYALLVGQTITSDGTVFPVSSQIIEIVRQTSALDLIVLNTAAIADSTSFTLKTTDINSIEILLPTLTITDKITSPVNLVLYRTSVNGSVFYRLSSVTSPTVNSTSADYVSFYDYIPDTQLVGDNQIYTTGGELENISAPAISTMSPYKSRIFAVTEEDPLTMWYSKQVISGSPVEFSDAFTITVNEKDGGVTGLSQMDDKLIIFKRNTVYYMVGDGPTPNGTQNDFTDPLLINSDAGCTNKKSVVQMPNGVMFQSTKGIYLLDRSLQVQYIGADVESYNSDTVTSAKLIEGVNQVRFTMLSGVCLVFDYYFNQWSVFTNISATDSTVFQNLYTYFNSAGLIYQETVGTYLDDTSSILMNLTTGWFSFAQLQGFERIYKLLFLGDWFSAHSLTFNFAYDFVSTYTQSTTVTQSTAPTTAYQFRIFLQQQKCESFQVNIAETQTAPFGQGLDLSAIAFEVGSKQGLNKLPAVQSYG